MNDVIVLSILWGGVLLIIILQKDIPTFTILLSGGMFLLITGSLFYSLFVRLIS